MANRLVVTRRTAQPPYSMGVDWSHPLLQNCEAAFDGRTLYVKEGQLAIPAQTITDTNAYGEVYSIAPTIYLVKMDVPAISFVYAITAPTNNLNFVPYASFGFYVSNADNKMLIHSRNTVASNDNLVYRDNDTANLNFARTYPVIRTKYFLTADGTTLTLNGIEGTSAPPTKTHTGTSFATDTRKRLEFVNCIYGFAFSKVVDWDIARQLTDNPWQVFGSYPSIPFPDSRVLNTKGVWTLRKARRQKLDNVWP